MPIKDTSVYVSLSSFISASSCISNRCSSSVLGGAATSSKVSVFLEIAFADCSY